MNARRVAEASKRSSVNRLSLGRVLNLVVTVAVLLLGPAMIIFGQHLINNDEELARTGVHATGMVVEFDDDVTKASQRRMQVEFFSLDGDFHRTWASVDHDQHPSVGDEVSVVYRELDPGQAIVLGYESDGVWFRGAGSVVTFLFLLIGLVVLISVLAGKRKRKKQLAGGPENAE